MFAKSFLDIKHLTIALAIICSGATAKAQYYSSGIDPGRVRWSSVKTQSFKIIYPRGLDSLAKEYGVALEKYKVPVSGSIGYTPNQMYRKQLPVILHAYNGISNGMVTWAPRRMELYTVMDPYEPDILPWSKNLAIHESRHASQMQFGKDGLFKIGHFLLGESFTGALSGIFPDVSLLEGDAVVTETALSNSGRGREADFLQWYRMSFDNGDMRSWYKWRYGSQKYYTPNYYTIGYMTIAGMRYLYDADDFTEKYFHRVSHGFPIKFNNFQKTIRSYSRKSLEKTFQDIASTYQQIWKKEDEKRLPPIAFERITSEPKKFTSYSKSVMTKDGIIVLKSGLSQAPMLVLIDKQGNEKNIRPFASYTSKLEYDSVSQRIFWSESIQDPRWELSHDGSIMYLDLGQNKINRLTGKGRFFNPAVSPDGTKLSVSEYPVEGGSFVTILDSRDGHVISRTKAQNDIQVVETAWTEDGLYASVITPEGFGIYKVEEGQLYAMLPAKAVKIKNLHTYGKGLAFTCDMTGVNEVYTLVDGVLRQITSTKYGASDFVFDGNEIYFANLGMDGFPIVKASAAPVADYLTYKAHANPIADKLSKQEKDRGQSESYTAAEFSSVKKYIKPLHLLHIHSWAPIYYSVDEIESQSFDSVEDVAGVGFTLAFQNNLNTLYGTAGYQFGYVDNKARNIYHFDFTYKGLYPVFQVKMDIGERNAIQYGLRDTHYDLYTSQNLSGMYLSNPSVSSEIISYIPLSFDKGGWFRGLIPQIRYTATNDFMNTSLVFLDGTGNLDVGGLQRFEKYELGENVLMQSLTGSIRGYIMRPTAASGIFPRLGIGFETGYRSRINLGKAFNSSAYFYTYGYLPGIIPEHGIRLTATLQHQTRFGAFYHENAVSTYPRGFADSSISRYLADTQRNQVKFTAEYAMPVLPVDWSFLSPLAYIRNFELKPFIDMSVLSSGLLYSTGSSFNVHLSNVAFLPAEASYGIVISYNGGSAYDSVKSMVPELNRIHIGASFNIDF